VCPHHQKLVAGLHEAGCEATVMHICGQAQPIVADVAGTGCDVMDVDCRVRLSHQRGHA
jgi:uroporphyrinogen-III decarboxylase